MTTNRIILDLAKYGYIATLSSTGTYNVLSPITGIKHTMNKLEALEALNKMGRKVL